MSTFICSECGAVFTGTLNETADAAFEHTAVHAERNRNPASRPGGLPSAKPAETDAFGETGVIEKELV